MIKSGISVRGAREHNLKNIDVFIPRNQLTVITGISGSGKSTLAFDTVYAEGQRRYVEGLSTYARQFLEQLKKPDVDAITGLSPAISIEQKTTVSSPRSTVGTTTELYDYLRLLFSKVGLAKCPNHNITLEALRIDSLIGDLLSLPEGTKIHLFSPVIRNKKGEFQKEIDKFLSQGFVKARIDGALIDLDSPIQLQKTKVHNIEILVDRLIIKPNIQDRLKESLESAIQLSQGYVVVENLSLSEEKQYSTHAACPICHFSPPDIEPRLFSFNDPRGQCPDCSGLGVQEEEEELSKEEEDSVIEEGSMCPTCLGSRLRQESLNIFVAEKNIYEVASFSLEALQDWVESLSLSERDAIILQKLLSKIKYRISFLLRLGLSHLSLSRPTRTLSGGEAQRIRLSNQLGSPLVGVLYVLDEPSIGLHPKDHGELLLALEELKNKGNTIIVVEHDESTILSADYVIDIGPGAGKHGGFLVAKGSPKDLASNPKSLTGQFLSKKVVPYQLTDKKSFSEFLKISGATGNNLRNLSVDIPLGSLTTVTGVSGSGKSTLIIDTLFKYLSNHFYIRNYHPSPFKKITGYDSLAGVIEINQKPIGRTPRSNPSTYTGLFSHIRELFSQLPESKIRGYKPGRFSFNVKGGRCEACEGAGQIKVEMHFMADVFVTCEICNGARYNPETLLIKYKEKSIADVLAMNVGEATEFFKNHPSIKSKLDVLTQVGLDYLTLGQSSTTLSGGEAQRIKLSKELSKKRSGHILYILDEPTTGLHFEDTRKLIELLKKLVEHDNTVVVIEHNLDLIASSDHVIDLGPESGVRGGEILFTGHPQDLIHSNASYTGHFLKDHLQTKPISL